MSVIFHENPGTSLGESSSSSDDLSTNDTTRTHNFISRNLSVESSPEWVDEIFGNTSFIDSPTHTAIRGFCRDVFSYRLPYLGVRYWDVAILIPNVLFLLFLLFKCFNVVRKMKDANSPVYRAFFALVYMSAIVNIIRCVYSMTVTVTTPFGQPIDQSLWVAIKFFYLTVEFCALTFGMLFGHLDNGSSIIFALLVTLLISIPHTIIQMIIEMKIVDNSWLQNNIIDYEFEEGGIGIAFWIITSIFLSLVYFIILCIPLICCKKYTKLPSRQSFFIYCMIMVLLNLSQALGATLVFFRSSDGLCLIGISTYLYFIGYSPVVYFAFLRKKIKSPPNNPSGMFMYRKHKDESGSGELPESYFPRFSGLTSPSYDDLFDLNRDARFTHYDISRNEYVPSHYNSYNSPLILSSAEAAETAESTVTTRTGSDDGARNSMLLFDSTHSGTTTRHLKGLGPHGSLVFEEQASPYRN